MTQVPVTVVVPVKDEECNLPHCLERLDRFAEVIVVDSMSSDATPEIARRYGAKLMQFHWNGRYPKKRNWVLMNKTLATDWVLFLDADELVSDRFCDAVAAAIAGGKHSGYWLNFRNHFFGRELRHGVPQKKLALFKVGSALYERIDELQWSKLDMEVHEHPIVQGSTGEIDVPVEHHDVKGISTFIERHREYAAWEAHRFLMLQQNGNISRIPLTARQKLKYAYLDQWWYPWTYFVHTYIIKRGFLDRSAGFYYSFYKLWYYCTIRLMIGEFRSSPASPRARVSAEGVMTQV